MNVILLSPEFPDTFWSFKHALRFIRRRASLPPLGLLTVAAMLPESWNKRLVDLNVEPLTDAHLAWADLALVGAMAVQRRSTRDVIARCRRAGVRVVAGGPLFTAEPEAFADVDHLVLGEAEISLPPFLADLHAGHARRVYRAGEYADMHASPIPLWELVDLKRYATMSVQFCRGCPYDCDFCNVTALLGHRPRAKTAAQVVAELDRLHALGWRGTVFFVDDNFIGNRRLLKTALLPALIDWRREKRHVPFTSQVSMDLADDGELMGMLTEAGFDSVFIGIETPDDEALAACNKKQNLGRDLVDDVRRMQRSGLEVYAGFIVGFDSDTPSTFRRQIDFIQRSGIVTAMVGMLQAPRGTRLYERMRAEGRLRGETTGDNVDGTTNIVPRMGLETLRHDYRALMNHIYTPEHYYRRLRTFLRAYRAPTVRPPIDLQQVLAFARAAGRLGVLGEERWHYWRLLLWTLAFRPTLLSRMVSLAIAGHHFRRVLELHVL
ncbi:MAG: B12-binding domain-containing radical SAM protein [Candidatus Eiseniibacteriota bacterium]